MKFGGKNLRFFVINWSVFGGVRRCPRTFYGLLLLLTKDFVVCFKRIFAVKF